MGRVPGSKNSANKKKKYKKALSTKNRPKDIDQIQDEIKKEEVTGEAMKFEIDEDLPGLGQFYCVPCARHFGNAEILSKHKSSKPHKRRMKDVAQEQYTQEEADRGSGKVKEVLPPAHPKDNMDTVDDA